MHMHATVANRQRKANTSVQKRRTGRKRKKGEKIDKRKHLQGEVFKPQQTRRTRKPHPQTFLCQSASLA